MISIDELRDNKPFLFWVGLLFILEIFSVLAWLYNPLAIIFLVLLALLLIFIYSRNHQFMILVPVLELFWGSMGRSIQYSFFSLRWLVFVVTIIFFLVVNFKKIKSLKIFYSSDIRRLFIGYFVLIFLFILVAILNHHSWQNIFYDVNAYFYFLYLPIWLEYYNRDILKKIINIVLASALVIAIKTIITFCLFTQSQFDLVAYYKWIRDTRTGEVTPLDNGFFRIFFQSQIYLLLAWAIIYDRLIKYKFKASYFFCLILFSSAIYISLSRSLWLGILVMIIYLIFSGKKILRALKYLFIVGLATYALVALLFNWPKYHEINLFSTRSVSSQEAALSTRTLLLPVMLDSIQSSPLIGHGFGQELTFNSNDPRSKNINNPSGQRTTFSFEWGWFDFMVKGGLILALFFVYSLFYIIRGTYAIIKSKPLFTPYLAIFLALPIIHIFTPYLNHPLGLGLLVLGIINTKNYD